MKFRLIIKSVSDIVFVIIKENNKSYNNSILRWWFIIFMHCL